MCLSATSSVACIQVVIPQRNIGKMGVPIEHVLDTEGSRKYATYHSKEHDSAAAREFSLCLQYQQGKCHMGPSCNQIHVDPHYLEKIDFWNSSKKTCCRDHGDFNSAHAETITNRYTFTITSESNAVLRTGISLAKFAYTAGLQKIAAEHDDRFRSNVIKTSIRQICRLHLDDQCRFGGDCSRLHLCREIVQELHLPQVPRKKTVSTVTPAATKAERETDRDSMPSISMPPIVSSTHQSSSIGNTSNSNKWKRSGAAGRAKSPMPPVRNAADTAAAAPPMLSLASLLSQTTEAATKLPVKCAADEAVTKRATAHNNYSSGGLLHIPLDAPIENASFDINSMYQQILRLMDSDDSF